MRPFRPTLMACHATLARGSASRLDWHNNQYHPSSGHNEGTCALSALLYYSKQDPADLWADELKKALPKDIDVRLHPDIGDPREIEFALCWQPQTGLLASLPNLKLIFSMAAGFDHLLKDPERPQHVPIVRIIDDTLSTMMSEFAVYAVLGFHRYMPAFHRDQRELKWQRRWPRFTADTHVGVLGLGAIGTDVAQKLAVFGFKVHGWSRTEKISKGITCHFGKDGLFEMLSQCQQTVCVLPLTKETSGILNNETLNAMPRGAYVTNIGRGGHVVDQDLLDALDSGQIAGAFLDVFNEEPLPTDHRYWSHPDVVMTPHIAGEIVPRSCAKSIAANIERFREGDAVIGIADLDRGY